MTAAILITQCLQRDFVAPVGPSDPLPNSLHVGWQETRRLLGPFPENGPLAQLMQWARVQPGTDLEIIHVRDWHNADDPAQRQHIEMFGPHCLAGSRGAELVWGDAAVRDRPNEHFVNSVTLNDFEGGTDLGELLRKIRSRPGAEPVRVGVVGVWTEAKVTFLLYELLTRCAIRDLATCSALTASASRTQHFIALEQLRRILGVKVFDSIGEFTSWLCPAGSPMPLPQPPAGHRPQLVLHGGAEVLEEDQPVLCYLFRDSAVVELQPLSGGFSGARVYRVRSRDALGHPHATSVLKLGPRELIAKERVAFEQVESILGNDAPMIRGFVDLGARAGIKFAYAAMGNGQVRSFQQLYESGIDLPRIELQLNTVFRDILGRFYGAAQYEQLNLLDYYTFSPAHAASVRRQIASLLGEQAALQPRLTFADAYCVANVADFYLHGLKELGGAPSRFHYVSYVHGDLNAANILLDERDNVWLIDFFHTHRGHLLRDLAKLENDLLYILTPVNNAEELAESLAVTAALRCVKDLRAPLLESIPGVQPRPELMRAWQTLRVLRRLVAEVCREERDPLPLSVALLRYAVHTLAFDESNRWQKLWALAAAGGHADDLLHHARDNRELRIDWLPGRIPNGRVGLTICPGRRDRGRDLDADLQVLAAAQVKRLLCLLTSAEMEFAGVTDLGERAAEIGVELRHVPILDQGIPTVQQMDAIACWLEQGLRSGCDTVLHCLGGLGRSGTVAACLLARNGMSPAAAIRVVREARGPRAIETAGQEQFVRDYSAVARPTQ